MPVSVYFHPAPSASPCRPVTNRHMMTDSLHPASLASPGRATVLIAPERVAGDAFARLADPGEGALLLFICGNFSRLLSRLPRRSRDFHMQRAFTAHQLLTALEDAYHTVVWVEHDPTLYTGADPALVRRIADALCDAARSSAVILSAPRYTGTVRTFARGAGRIIAVLPAESSGSSRSYQRSQATLAEFGG